MKSFASALLSACLIGSALVGCSRDVIPNTDVEDNDRNREVIAFVEQYRKALERRDTAILLRLVSERYYDDNGTPQGDDDVDYFKLKKLLNDIRDRVLDVRYEMRYRRVIENGERTFVDYTYTGSFRIKAPDGTEHWTRKVADNRIVLIREKKAFKIFSGM